MPTYILLMSRTTMQVSIYQSSEQQSSRVLIGSGNLEYASNSLFCDRSQWRLVSRHFRKTKFER